MRIRNVSPLMLLFGLLACGDRGAANGVGSFRAKVVTDRAVMLFVRGFEVAVLDSTSRKGTAVTCGDFPSTYVFGHPDLRLRAKRFLAWSGQQGETNITLDVPPGENYLVAVEGRAPLNGSVQHVVARGCKENIAPTLETTTAVEIDVTATSGRPCSAPQQCEPAFGECLQGGEFTASGYCGRAGCSDDTQCPPGTKCVNVGNGTACARACESKAGDCETRSGQVCLRRLGPGSACHGVCLKATAGDNC